MNRLGVGNFRLSGSKWLAEKRFFRLSQTTLFGELLSYYQSVTILQRLFGLSLRLTGPLTFQESRDSRPLTF